MKAYTPFTQRAQQVNEGNWRERLNDLKAEYGTWDRVAGELGVSPATLRRYRAGGYSRGGGRRVALSPTKIIPKVRSAVQANKKVQLRNVDWGSLSIKGTLTIGGSRRGDSGFRRTQRMDIGRYMDQADMEALASAYLSGSSGRFNRAMDFFIDDRYLAAFPGSRLIDVEDLEW